MDEEKTATLVDYLNGPEAAALPEGIEVKAPSHTDPLLRPPKTKPVPWFPHPVQRASLLEGEWNGHPNYGCSECGLWHLDRAKVEAHLPIHGTKELGA